MYSKLSCNEVSVGMPRNGIYSLQPHASFVKIVVALTRAVLDAQSAAQRQPGHSRGDPAGLAERPPTPTADRLDRPSFGATVDHRAGACAARRSSAETNCTMRGLRAKQAQICRP